MGAIEVLKPFNSMCVLLIDTSEIDILMLKCKTHKPIVDL